MIDRWAPLCRDPYRGPPHPDAEGAWCTLPAGHDGRHEMGSCYWEREHATDGSPCWCDPVVEDYTVSKPCGLNWLGYLCTALIALGAMLLVLWLLWVVLVAVSIS